METPHRGTEAKIPSENDNYHSIAYITQPTFIHQTLIYTQYLRSTLTYAAAAWLGIAKSRLKLLQVLQNRCLRRIGGYDWYTRVNQMHEDLQIPYITTYMKHQAHRLYQKTLTNPNTYINELGAYDPRHYTKHKTPLHYL